MACLCGLSLSGWLHVVACTLTLTTVCQGLRDPAFGEDPGHVNTAVELAMARLHGHAGILAHGLETLLTSADQKATLAWLTEVVDSDNGTEAVSPVCEACTNAVDVLKSVASNRSWIVVRPILNQACLALINAVDDTVRADIMCPGIIDHQAKAIYDILKEDQATPAKFCENLNACIPPRDTASQAKSRSMLQAFQERGPHYNVRDRRRADDIRIVQLADIHIEPAYAEGSPTDCGLPVCCQESLGAGSAGPWGDYQCNIPVETMYLFLRKAAALNPDFIIFSGDTPPHSVWDETYESQLECTKTLIQAVNETITGVPVYPNIGNHEMYPTNLYYTGMDATRDLNLEFASLWTPFANFTSEQTGTMEEAGYYATMVKPGLRMISFNTNYWYAFNFYNVLNEGMAEFTNMKLFMEQQLETARNNGEQVIMVGHHPPSNADIIVTSARWLTDLIAEYEDIIVLQLGGHTHYDEFRLVKDYESQTPAGVVFIAPSVTTKTLKNPSLRVFHLDGATHELLDYDQYHMDLMEAVANGTEPDIELVYSAAEEFGLVDMSPGSWADFLDRMWEDEELLGRYLERYTTGTIDDPLDGCDRYCQIRYLCKFGSGSFDLNLNCLEENDVPLTGDEPTTLSTTVGFSSAPTTFSMIRSVLLLITIMLTLATTA